MAATLLNDALEHAAHGWPIIGLHSPTPSGCSCVTGPDCDKPGKHPRWHRDLLPHGSGSATTDANLIREWWRLWPDANIGLATGKPSGISVLDVDGERSAASLAARIERHGELPHTLRSRTGSGGLHYLFSYPGVHLSNTASVLNPGLDIRCCGGLIVLPPSLHASGRRYAWEVGP